MVSVYIPKCFKCKKPLPFRKLNMFGFPIYIKCKCKK